MSFGDKVNKYLLYDGLTKEEYDSVEEYIINENNKRLLVCNYVAAVVIFGLFIASFIFDRIASKTLIYCLGVISNIVMIFLLHSKHSKNYTVSKVINYYFISLMLLFTLYVGTITSNGLPASTFFTCLALAPYITNTKVLYGFIHRAVMVIIFIILSYIYKPFEHFSTDLMNVLVVFVISTFASAYLQKLQVNSYVVKKYMDIELDKMSGIFEKIRVIDLTGSCSIEYSQYSKDVATQVDSNTNAIEQMEKFVENYVGENNRTRMRQFCDLSTLADRMYSNKVIERDFISYEGIWERAIIVSIEEDKKGFPTKVAFSIKRIADQYYLKDLNVELSRIK